jgi:hypothetical protein
LSSSRLAETSFENASKVDEKIAKTIFEVRDNCDRASYDTDKKNSSGEGESVLQLLPYTRNELEQSRRSGREGSRHTGRSASHLREALNLYYEKPDGWAVKNLLENAIRSSYSADQDAQRGQVELENAASSLEVVASHAETIANDVSGENVSYAGELAYRNATSVNQRVIHGEAKFRYAVRQQATVSTQILEALEYLNKER